MENDLAVQVHESLVNNFAAALLSGVTLKEEDVQKQAIDLLGKLPEQLKSEEDRDPWSITFAKIRPVTIKFADNGFQVTIRGQRLHFGRTRLSGHERHGRLQDRKRDGDVSAWCGRTSCKSSRPTSSRAERFRADRSP